MNRERDKVFIGESIRLDYSRWENCVFKDCEIITLTGDFDLVNCDFQNCKLTLEGNAQTIAKLMHLFFPDKIPLIFPEGGPEPLASTLSKCK